MKRRPKYQVVIVPVPNATAAATLVEASTRLDSDYAFCTGVAVSIGQPGTIQNAYGYLDFGLRDPSGTIHDDCHNENWQASAAVDPNKKFKDLLIPCKNQLIYARVTPPSVMTAQMTIQFIFRLEDSLEVISVEQPQQ